MNLVKNKSKLFLFSFVFLSKKYILIIVRFKRRMRGSSHAIQNLIKVKLYFSTIQGELKIKACTEYLKDQNQTLSPFLKFVRVLLNSSRWSLMNVYFHLDNEQPFLQIQAICNKFPSYTNFPTLTITWQPNPLVRHKVSH